jgi:hypothetical protein
LELHKDLY